MEENQPIKRSKELAPLSREHHDGLLFVWKIRQGLDNGADIQMMSNYARWYWANHIKPHFKDEEKVLIQYLSADNDLVKRMINEHTHIRNLVLSLDEEPDKYNLKKLADFIYDHIRFEERELFKYAEETLSHDHLNFIYHQLASESYCETEWKDEFWVKK